MCRRVFPPYSGRSVSDRSQSGDDMPQLAGIDGGLKAAIDRGDVPGVVAMARYLEKRGVPGIICCENGGLALPVVLEAGEKWDYWINIDWVGKAVERASGQLLGDYFAERLFGPIGMKDTGFRLTPDRRA